MNKKTLTNKERCVVNMMSKNVQGIDAVLSCYDINAKDKRKSASVVLTKLNKKELFSKELVKAKDLVNDIRRDEGQKFCDILKELIKPRKVAEILKDIIEGSKDTRNVMDAIKEYNKVLAHYPDTKMGIYRDLNSELKQLYTEADLERLKSAKINLLEAEEGVIINKEDNNNETNKETTKEEAPKGD